MLPYVKITKLNRRCNFGDKSVFRHTEVDSQPSKKSKKSCGKGSAASLKKSKQPGCVSRIPGRRNPSRFYGGARNFWDQIAPCTFQKGTLHHVTLRKRRGPSQGVIQKCEAHERSPCAPKFEDRTQEETLQQERCARREAGDLARNVHKVNDKDKVTFVSPSEVWSSPGPPSKKPEEREFVVDCGASMHMLSMEALNSMELETIWESRNPTTAITANGKVQTNDEATAYVHDLELFVTVHILEDTPAVLSSGQPCEEHGYSYEWASGQKPQLTKNGKRILCNTELVPIVVPGSSTGSSSSSASTSSTSFPQDTADDTSSSPATSRSDDTSIPASGYQSRDPTKTNNKNTNRNIVPALGNRLPGLPEWLQEFTHYLAGKEVPASRGTLADASQDPGSERPTPKDRNGKIYKRNKITGAPCRKLTGVAVHRAENFGDLIAADHKVLNEGGASRNNHRCNRGAGLGHPMDPVVSVQNQNFTRNPKKLAKVSGTREETKSHLH